MAVEVLSRSKTDTSGLKLCFMELYKKVE
ncbi:hypothetical protein LSH36_117g04017, partial [Paralvinella palmiformis]